MQQFPQIAQRLCLGAVRPEVKGQLGNGTTTNSLTPGPVALPSGVTATAVAAGIAHSLAIGSNGKVYSWGYNGFGQLGDGTTFDSSTPLAITLAPGVTTTAIPAGTYHSLAIGSNGKVYSWGNNYYGQLGNGTTTTSLTPVAITLSNGVTATAIGAGYGHSLAIGSDGKTYAWGFNNIGQLGNGTTTDSHTPLAVNLPAGMTSLVLGTGSEASHSLAILTSAPTAAILSGFHVVHAGNALSFHWRVASGAGLRGFFLTAGTHRLNRLLIALDAHQQSNAFVSRWQGHDPYLLHGVMPGGAVVTLASTG